MKALNPEVGYIVKNGKPISVILPLEQYEELLEDLHDLARIAQRKNEPTIPLDEVVQRLEKKNAGIRR